MTGPSGEGSGSLPPAVVAPDEYDEHYFRTVCAGSGQWSDSAGAKLAGVYPSMLRYAGFRSGEVVVDLGTGRGELPVVAAKWGASRAIGVEYSAAGVRLAHRTVHAHGVGDIAEIVHADARALPFRDSSTDLVTMLDVVEHLAPNELSAVLAEVRRILRPGGRLLIHTFPTRTIYEVTYRTMQAVARNWPANPRNDYEIRMHVNEQTRRGLLLTLRAAGFTNVDVRLGDWVYLDHLPANWARGLVRHLARWRLTAALARADLLATARR